MEASTSKLKWYSQSDIPGKAKSLRSTVSNYWWKGDDAIAENDIRLKLILVFFVSICIFLLQYRFRVFDDNRLLSWRWIASNESILSLLAPLCIGLVLLYGCCRIRVSEKLSVISLVVMAAIISVFSWQSPEIIVDSARYFIHAKTIQTQGLPYFLSAWGTDISAWTDLPLISILYGILFSAFGESRIAIQFVNCAFLAGSAIFTYLIGKQIWDTRSGLYAAFLLLAIPYLHIQTALMLVDLPAMFFVSLAIWACLVAMQSQNTLKLSFASICVVLAILCKYSTWIVLGILAFLPLVISGNEKIQKYKRLGIIVLLSSVILIVIGLFYYPIIIDQFNLLFLYQWQGLKRWEESYVSTFLFQVHPIITILLAISIGTAVKTKNIGYVVLALPVFAFFVLGVKRARYLVVIYPFIALLAAFGLNYFREQIIRKYLVGSALFVSILVSLGLSIPFLSMTGAANLAAAGKYIDSLQDNDVLVILSKQHRSSINPIISMPLLDYHTNTKLQHFYSNYITEQSDLSNRQTSSLRFTWQLRPIPYNRVTLKNTTDFSTLVLISSGSDQEMSDALKQKLSGYISRREFLLKDGVFKYQTIVKIYRKIA